MARCWRDFRRQPPTFCRLGSAPEIALRLIGAEDCRRARPSSLIARPESGPLVELPRPRGYHGPSNTTFGECTCWESWVGPRTGDAPLRDVVDVLLKVEG